MNLQVVVIIVFYRTKTRDRRDRDRIWWLDLLDHLSEILFICTGVIRVFIVTSMWIMVFQQ
jgi:hypothetical protein